MSLTILRKVSVSGGTVLRAANNLGDVASLPTTLINLGVPQMRNALATAQGLVFDGTGTPAAVSKAFPAIFTIAATVNPKTLGVSGRVIAQGTNIEFGIYSDGRPYIYDGTTIRYGTTVVSTAVASHVAYTLTGTTGTFYVNGVAAGSVTDTNTYGSLTGLGGTNPTSGMLGVISNFLLENRALSAAEVLALYQTGAVAAGDIYGSGVNTTITAGAFVSGKKYRILVVGTTDFTLIGASANTIGVEFTATGVGTGTGTATAIGALIAPEANAPGNGYQLRDTSGNKADIALPATGVDWSLKSESGPFQVRATLTWSGTHEAKSLLGQIALPTKAVLTSIITEATVASSGSGLIVGSVTTPALFVAANSYTTARKVHTLAAQIPAGTATNDLSLVLDPDTANYTGTIQVWVNYVVTN